MTAEQMIFAVRTGTVGDLIDFWASYGRLSDKQRARVDDALDGAESMAPARAEPSTKIQPRGA